MNQQFSIDGRLLGQECPVYIIAEAGVSHFGSLEKAFQLVDLACLARADAVKFQIFTVNDLFATESAEWRQRLANRCLPYEDFDKIQAYCLEKKITFFATAHDEPSLEYLSQLDVPAYKVGSGEVRNWPFLAKVASLGKPIIFSTGMYTMTQVEEAMETIAATGNKNVALLHCITSYPTPANNVNLRAMDRLRERFNVVTGYSDHTKGIHFPLAAVARGARIIEKHITLEYDIPNAQDWKVSCSWGDLPEMVSQIRDIEVGLGSGTVEPTAAEKESLAWAGKSLVSAVSLEVGQRLRPEMIVCKRPGTGIPPSEMGSVLNKTVKNSIAADTVIKIDDLE